MPKPDPALLDPAHYPWRHAITTRFSDVDPNQHLNNVAIAAMFEDARVRFNGVLGFRDTMEHRRAMVASVGIEYLAQGYYPDPVEALAACETAGRSSWSIVQLLTQGGRNVGFARTIVVCIDGDSPCPIPAAFRTNLECWGLTR